MARRNPEADIRSSGLRCTAQRIAVLTVLREQARHLRVEEVSELVRSRIAVISGQAVYDALAALVSVGLARRIEPAGSPALFEARAGDNHHHVVCRHCGTAADVDCVASAPCLDASSTTGYVIDEAEITFWGICPACQQQPDTGTTVRNTKEPSNG
ncbi:MAG TPA: Fur family transcriptional regulator [Acidimicrobiales bacterium]|nr:Fur family transcriptional regulator [Acidimicrobiales bacterium]